MQFLWKGTENLPSELKIVLGSSSLSAAVLGISTPIDAGEHNVVVTAPGKKEYRTALRIEGDGKVFVLEIPDLASLPRPTSRAGAKSCGEESSSVRSWGGILAVV